jgi:ribosomal protein S8E
MYELHVRHTLTSYIRLGHASRTWRYRAASHHLRQKKSAATALHSVRSVDKRYSRCQLPQNLCLHPSGTIIEVNVSELGLVTAGGKVVWGRYAQ